MRPQNINSARSQDTINTTPLQQPAQNNINASFAASLFPQGATFSDQHNLPLPASSYKQGSWLDNGDNSPADLESFYPFSLDAPTPAAFAYNPQAPLENPPYLPAFLTAEQTFDAPITELPAADFSNTITADTFTPALDMHPELLAEPNALTSINPFFEPALSEAGSFIPHESMYGQDDLQQLTSWDALPLNTGYPMLDTTAHLNFTSGFYPELMGDNTVPLMENAFNPLPISQQNTFNTSSEALFHPTDTVFAASDTLNALPAPAEPTAAKNPPRRVDPETGKPSTAENAIPRSTFQARRKARLGKPQTTQKPLRRVDPATGKTSTAPDAIPYSTFKARKKVDPVTGAFSTAPNAIPYGTFRSQKKVDPVTGKPSTADNAISYIAFQMRKTVDPVTGKISTAPHAIRRYEFDNRIRDMITAEKETYPDLYEQLKSRKKVDPQTGKPSTAANAISRSTYSMRLPVDPVTGKPSTADNAISRSQFFSRQMVDPFTGKASNAEGSITRSQYVNAKKVDPLTGLPSTANDAILVTTYRNRQLVDPVTGEPSKAEGAIPYSTYSQRKSSG